MAFSGWILIAAFALAPGAGHAAPYAFRDLLTVDDACGDLLEPRLLGATIAAHLDIPDATSAYVDASLVEMQSPFARALDRPHAAVDASAFAMNAAGLRLELSSNGTQLILREQWREVHRWTLTEPIAEVHFSADLDGDGGGDFALVGWFTRRDYRLSDGHLVEVERAPAAPASPWIPARRYREPGDDLARVAALAARPVPTSRLREALGELMSVALERAQKICAREEFEPGLISRTYPNQMLALAAQVLRDRPPVRELLVMTTNELADGRFALRLPRGPDPHGPDVLEIRLPHCAPLVLSISDDPYADPLGWGVLRERQQN